MLGNNGKVGLQDLLPPKEYDDNFELTTLSDDGRTRRSDYYLRLGDAKQDYVQLKWRDFYMSQRVPSLVAISDYSGIPYHALLVTERTHWKKFHPVTVRKEIEKTIVKQLTRVQLSDQKKYSIVRKIFMQLENSVDILGDVQNKVKVILDSNKSVSVNVMTGQIFERDLNLADLEMATRVIEKSTKTRALLFGTPEKLGGMPLNSRDNTLKLDSGSRDKAVDILDQIETLESEQVDADFEVINEISAPS